MTSDFVDPAMLRALRQRGLSRDQIAFIQATLLAGTRSRIFARSALSHPTVAVMVPWATGLVDEHRRTGQPREGPALAGVEAAARACRTLIALRPRVDHVVRWGARLDALRKDLRTSPLPSVSATTLRDHYRICLATGLNAANRGAGSEEQPLWAAEAGVGLLASGRDVHSLTLQLHEDWAIGIADLTDLFFPVPKSHHVMIGVHGVKDLAEIESRARDIKLRLLPKQPWRRRFAGWSGAGHTAARIASLLENITITFPGGGGYRNLGADALLLAEVTAVDHPSAALIGKRRVAEALDEFTAGHPDAHIRLMDLVTVSGADDQFLTVQNTRPPVAETLRPLPAESHASLRPAMRASMLLRATESPLNRAAMAWVVIETAGVQSRDEREWAAKALALQVLRQRTFLPYRLLATSDTSRAEARRFRRYAQNRRQRARRYAKPAPAGAPRAYASARRRAVEIARIAEGLNMRVSRRLDGAADLHQQLVASIQTALGAQGTDRGYLSDTDAWLRLVATTGNSITSTDAASSPEDALASLLSVSSPLVTLSVDALKGLAADPAAGRLQLQTSQQWAATALDLLYAARNMNFHAGRYTAEGDLALDHLGLLVPDALIELWARWYESPPRQRLSCVDILRELAARFDILDRRLGDGVTLDHLDIGQCTGPHWSVP